MQRRSQIAETPNLEWNITLDGHPWSGDELAKRKLFFAAFSVGMPEEDRPWIELLKMALEKVGVKKALEATDPRLWREAAARLNLPWIPPIHLPVNLWDAYQAAPFSGVTLHLKSGEKLPIEAWSMVHFCWHDCTLAVLCGDKVRFLDVAEVLRVEPNTPSPGSISLLQRLVWLHRAPQFLPFVIRTSDGNGYLISSRNRLQIHRSGTLAAVAMSDEAFQFISLCDVTSVTLCAEETAEFRKQIDQLLRANPFLPLKIEFCGGAVWMITKPNQLWVAGAELLLGDANGGVIFEKAARAGIEWINRITVMSGNT